MFNCLGGRLSKEHSGENNTADYRAAEKQQPTTDKRPMRVACSETVLTIARPAVAVVYQRLQFLHSVSALRRFPNAR